MHHRYLHTSAFGLAAAALLPIASPALAQSQPEPTPDEVVASEGVEEITVTAQRFASSIQTTPIAVSAFSANMLDERQVMNIADLNSQVPGILIQPAPGISNIARVVLRGIGQENGGVLYDPAVGIYVDNVYQPRPQNQFFDFFDIERVEVLRGPQGTLYGRNTSGGAMKIVTRRPSSELLYGGDVAFGSYNTTDFRGYVSGGLTEGIAASLSAVFRRRDGYLTAPAYGPNKVNDRNSLGVRAKLLFELGDSAELELSGSYVRDRTEIALGTPRTSLPGVNNPNAVPDRDLLSTEFSGYRAQKTDSYNVSANLTVDLSDTVSVLSTTAYGHMYNLTGTPLVQTATGVIGTSYDFKDDFFSQELTLNYTSDALKLVGGLFYFHEKGKQNDTAPYNTPADKDRTTDAYAVFGQGTLELFEGFSVIAGLRYTQEKAKFSQFYPTFAQFIPSPQSASRTFKKVTPKFGIDWELNPNAFFYASYTEGFKSGGFNSISPGTIINGVRGAPVSYDAEQVKSYEVGGKFMLLDRRLRLNVAAFRADYEGIHLPVFFPGTAISTTNNAAGARVQGIELETSWRITPEFEIYGTGAVTDGDYTSAFPCAIFNTQIVDCQDRDLKGLSPFKSTVGFSLDLPGFADGVFNLDGSWEHSAKFYNNVSNTIEITATPTYDLFNASIGWTDASGKFSVTLEGRNITDKQFALSGLQISNATSPAVTSYVNEPRTVLVRFKLGL